MEIDPFSILTLFGFTIVVGYVGSAIFEKTKIPDVIWLLLFGIIAGIFGPEFGLNRDMFITLSPFLAALALIIILFDAGLNMDFYQMINSFSRAATLAILGSALVILSVGVIASYFFQLSLIYGLILGSIIAGTCSTTVTSMARGINLGPKAKNMISLESVLTDPLVVVLTIALLNIATQTGSAYSPLQGILSAFSIGAVVGMFTGILWLFILDKLKGKQFDYMLTLAALFLIYVFVESFQGSGAIAALSFGLVVGNGLAFAKILRVKKKLGVNHLLKTFQSEVSFFIRSFFFMYIGLIATVNMTYFFYGLIITGILILTRLIAVQVSTIGMKLSRVEKNIMRSMVPRGLAAAVLAQLPLTFKISGAEIFSNIIFIVIIATVVYTTIAVKIFSK